MRTPADAERLTRVYPSLRGVQFAPTAVFFACWFFANAVTPMPLDSLHRLWLLIPAIVANVIVSLYLNRTYGVVRNMSAGRGVAIVVIVLIAFFFLQGIAASIIHVDLLGVLFGLMALVSAVSSRRWYWLVPAIVALLQPVIFPHQMQGFRTPTPAMSAWWGMYWTAWALASLWDYRLLVRSFDDGAAK